MIDVAALITDYIDTCIPNWQDDKSAEIYNDHIKVIHFLADRDWEKYRVEYKNEISISKPEIFKQSDAVEADNS